jgi:hypothetical protein
MCTVRPVSSCRPQNVFNTAFTVNTTNQSYLWNIISPTAQRYPHVIKAIRTGTAARRGCTPLLLCQRVVTCGRPHWCVRTGATVSSARLTSPTALGDRPGFSTDWFLPLYPLNLNASGEGSHAHVRAHTCPGCPSSGPQPGPQAAPVARTPTRARARAQRPFRVQDRTCTYMHKHTRGRKRTLAWRAEGAVRACDVL